MSDDTSDNVVHVFAPNGKLIRPEAVEVKLRTFFKKILTAMFQYTGNTDPSEAVETLDASTDIDTILKYTSEINSTLSRYLDDTAPQDVESPEPEGIPFRDDPDRFLAWSLMATALSPRIAVDRVTAALKEATVAEVEYYINGVKDVSETFVKRQNC